MQLVKKTFFMGDFKFGNTIDWKSNVSHGQGKIFFENVLQNFFNTAR